LVVKTKTWKAGAPVQLNWTKEFARMTSGTK
jgi:hypothetical protein